MWLAAAAAWQEESPPSNPPSPEIMLLHVAFDQAMLPSPHLLLLLLLRLYDTQENNNILLVSSIHRFFSMTPWASQGEGLWFLVQSPPWDRPSSSSRKLLLIRPPQINPTINQKIQIPSQIQIQILPLYFLIVYLKEYVHFEEYPTWFYFQKL